MKTNSMHFSAGVLAGAVRAALAAMCAVPLAAQAQSAAEDEAAALKRPANVVEIGALHINGDAAKFGEYNGLNRSGGYGVANFGVRGGDAYGGGDGTLRWGLTGTELGTSARELGASVADQGRWNVGLRYDELLHTITRSYQTPFQGAMGGNTFTLPASFGIIDTTAVTGSPNPLVGTRNLSAVQQSSFHTEDVGSSRKNAAFSAGYQFDRRWSVSFDYNRLDQSGAKLISAASSDARTGAGAAGSWGREAMVTLMNPTNYNTHTVNLALNWIGDAAYLNGAFFGSYFRDGYNSLSWMNPMGLGSNVTGLTTTTLAGGYQANMLSTTPSNNFNQLNLTGGYALRPATKLSGGLSYGRNTQNDMYLVDLMQTGGIPRTSLDALVVTTHADLKLTDQSIKNLALSAGLKYNERDNRTPSDVYRMFDIGGGPAAAANSGTRRTEINTPYSLRRTELALAADYRFTSRQNLRLSYEHEEVKRWCDNVAGAAAPDPAVVGVVAGNAASPAGANCVIVPSSHDNRFGLNYRLKTGEALRFDAGYLYSRRIASTDYNALTPLNDQAGANGTGIVNASNYKGYNAFFDASRTQDLLKGGLNWQASERWSLGLSGRHSADRYIDSTLGVQKGAASSANLDVTYGYSDNGSIAAYVTYQGRERDMLSGASGLGATDNATSYAALVAPKNIWSNRLSDRDRTLGLNGRQKGLMGGKLEIVGDVSLSFGRTQYHTEVPYYVPTATAPTCDAATLLACGDTPEIYNRTLQFKLVGYYQVDKKSRVALGYQLQRQRSNDYYYNVYQYGFSSSTMLPTNQLAPNYTVNLATATYIYTF